MSGNGMITSKHPKMTNEMYMEVLDIFKTLSEDFHFEYFPADKIPLALKSMGLDPPNDATIARSLQTETVDMKEWAKIVAEHLDGSSWCAAEMAEAFGIFDKDGNGYLDPIELKRVFTKLGESLTDAEMEDQLREFDIDNDCKMVVGEWFKMVLTTRGVDYVFDDV
jgi:Ca2+-binding EF-hand superfamily protein